MEYALAAIKIIPNFLYTLRPEVYDFVQASDEYAGCQQEDIDFENVATASL